MALEFPGVRWYTRRLGQFLRAGPKELPEVNPPPLPPGEVVTLPGRGDVFVRDQPGPKEAVPLLLLHGWLASAELNWFGVFSAFTGERRVIAIDHRGHGRGMRSPKPFRLVDCADDAAALLDELNVPEAIVCGFSMGGPIALLMARDHRSHVAGLVPASTSAVFSGSWGEHLRWQSLRLLELAVRLGLGDRLTSRLAAELGGVDERFMPYTSWLVGEITRTQPRTVREAGLELSRFDARVWAPELNLPAAMVVTETDSLVPRHRQEALIESLAAYRVPMAGADHDVPIRDPAGFAQAIHTAVGHVAELVTSPVHSNAQPLT